MSKAIKDLELFKRDLLRRLLEGCTVPQVNLFNRMYESLDKVPTDRLDWAIQQVERTIEANDKAYQELSFRDKLKYRLDKLVNGVYHGSL